MQSSSLHKDLHSLILVCSLENESSPFYSKFKQAYIDIPFAKRDVDLARSHFQKEYNVPNEDIFAIYDLNMKETRDEMNKFKKVLEEERKKG